MAVGQRPGDSDNTFILPGYARLDTMSVSRHRIGQHRLTAQLRINNLLDKAYYANTDGGSLGVTPGTPLQCF